MSASRNVHPGQPRPATHWRARWAALLGAIVVVSLVMLGLSQQHHNPVGASHLELLSLVTEPASTHASGKAQSWSWIGSDGAAATADKADTYHAMANLLVGRNDPQAATATREATPASQQGIASDLRTDRHADAATQAPLAGAANWLASRPQAGNAATRSVTASPAAPTTVDAPSRSSDSNRTVATGPVIDPGQPSFDGRPLRVARTLTMKVTAYSPDHRSCGKWADGITASGKSVWTNGMKLVAADTRLLPFGSVISVPGYNGGRPVPVLDIGGKIKGHRLDVLYPTHEIARRWGVKTLTVTVYEYAD